MALLPLNKEERVAFLGPYAEEQDMNSSWAITGRKEDQVSIRSAAEEVLIPGRISFGRGCMILDNDTMLNLDYYQVENWEQEQEKCIREAAVLAAEADTVVLCLGEHRRQSGEATSRGILPCQRHSLNCSIRLRR